MAAMNLKLLHKRDCYVTNISKSHPLTNHGFNVATNPLKHVPEKNPNGYVFGKVDNRKNFMWTETHLNSAFGEAFTDSEIDFWAWTLKSPYMMVLNFD